MSASFTVDDPDGILALAAEFADEPGVPSDAAVKNFLDRFPLPIIFNWLRTKTDEPGLEETLVACLERIFRTKYGASQIPHYMAVVRVGLLADSNAFRQLACKTVVCLLEHSVEDASNTVRLITEYDIYSLLLDCLINGDETVAAAATDAITKLAGFPKGIDIIFPADDGGATHLGNLAVCSSSLVRVRIFSLMVKIFSLSESAARVVSSSNLLNSMEAGISNTNDSIETSNILELLYELAEVHHSTEFLSRTTLFQLLYSLISNPAVDVNLRLRAIMISGRLLSKENAHRFVDESIVKSLISAIDGRLGFLGNLDTAECESALEALGDIGLSIQGATLLLVSVPPTARHVIDAAFDRQGRGKQLAALHALANIAGESRSETTRILNSTAEESLRRLIYEVASRSTKLTPSGLVSSILQQAAEIRLAGYRMVSGLVARSWFLMEICSKQEIINIVTDATTETTKIGMDARYNCCKSIDKAFASSNLIGDPAFAAMAEKLEGAVRSGPYLARKHAEAQPAVMTAERF